MGAWGEKALSNDAALDYIEGRISENLNDIVASELDRIDWGDVESFRALAHFAAINNEHCNFWIEEASVKKFIEGLKALLDDEHWIGDWKEPEKIRNEVQKQLDYFENLIEKGFYRKEK